MLALGIAANVAVFSLVNGLFLKPFPFAHPDRLVYINETAPRWNLDVVGVNYPDFDRWRKDVKLFEAIALYETDNFNMSDGNGAERVRGAQVTLDFPRVLGVQPVLGRFFTPEEDAPRAPAQQPGAPKLAQVPQVVVIGEALWKERFGGALDVVGKTLRMDGQSRTIVGVMPVEASFPDGVRLWVPMGGDPNQPDQSYSGDGIGRLKPGVTAAAASQDLIRTQQPIWDTRDKDHIVSPFAKPLREQLVSDYTTAASTISAAVGILLLIACANVAAIMLARALARRREMGIRLALGSSRARLMRQLFIENLMLAAVGGAIGLLAGQWAIGAFVRMIPDSLPRWAAFQLDARVMAFSLASVVATVIFFGWAPALHAVGGNLRSAVHASTNGTTAAPRGRRTLSFIVAAEFALAALLLVGGMLLVKAFDRVRHVDPGFRADHVLTFSIPLPVPMSEAASPQPERWMAFWDSLAERTRQLPGVDFAGLVSCAPFGGCHLGNFLIADNALPRPDGKNPVVLIRTATPGYFEAMGLRLREGRFLQEPDGREKRTPVVVVNESFVRTFWGDRANGLGRRVKFNGEDQRWMTIVGVVSDVKHYGLERPMRPGIYVPLVSYPRPTMTMAVHTQVDPESIAPAVREMVRRVDPELPVVGLRTMEESIRRSMALRAAFSWMLAVFAALAFVLAIGGAYGVSTYLVSQRTREIGIRVALGARTVDIFRSILGRGLGVVTTGVACGLTGFVLLGRLLGAVLFGVSPHDATVLAPVALVLIATALMANGLPARRAARLDPMRTLRTE
jgi:predicted permease